MSALNLKADNEPLLILSVKSPTHTRICVCVLTPPSAALAVSHFSSQSWKTFNLLPEIVYGAGDVVSLW